MMKLAAIHVFYEKGQPRRIVLDDDDLNVELGRHVMKIERVVTPSDLPAVAVTFAGVLVEHLEESES